LTVVAARPANDLISCDNVFWHTTFLECRSLLPEEGLVKHCKAFGIATFALTALCSSGALAVDGVTLIDQNRALAGNVTPGDAAGFPVTISRAGSYRLSGNLDVTNANTTAIEITASNVTIDLNGFAILGLVTCNGTPVTSCTPAGTGSGITVSGTPSNIAVRNGAVRGMGSHGINLGLGVHGVTDVRVESNGGVGIFVSGGTVSHTIVTSNGDAGIVMGLGTVSHNNVTGNRSDGIQVQDSATVSHNASIRNGGHGILTLRSGTVNHNTALENGEFGLRLGSVTGFTGNAMHNNGTGAVAGGVSLGGNHNLCNGILC
jgi:hypothetical protein